MPSKGTSNRVIGSKTRGLMVGVGVLATGLLAIAWLAHPVCVPLSSEDLKSFNVPIEQRSDRDIFHFKTFQRRDGGWCQCKSWISRQLFF